MKADIQDRGKTGIYCIINKTTNKMYIGKAKCIHKRIKGYIADCNTKNINENRYLINAWHKYGRSDFHYVVLEYTILDEAILKERELYWQIKYNVTKKKFGYNFRLDSSTNMIVHKSTSKKISKRLKKEWKNGSRATHGAKLVANWALTPERNLEQSKVMSKALTKYSYNLYDLQSNFIMNCNFSKLKELNLSNVQGQFTRHKKNKLIFKSYIIERILL